MLSYLPVKIEDFLARLEQVKARDIVAKWTQADRDPYSKTPWAASTLSRGYKDERSSRAVQSQSFDLTSYNVVVPPREALGSLARKRPAEDIDLGKNKRAKTGSVLADKRCHERDGGCFLTKTNPTVSKVVHIYPPSMKDPNTAGVVMFWHTLRMFLNEDRVNAWWQAIYGDEAGTEKPQNQICMSPSAHEMYTQNLFAIEPLPLNKKPEGMELAVRIWWLKPAESTGRVDLTTQPQLPSDFDPSGHSLGLHNVRKGEPIRSGDVITLQTHDPISHPLPGIRILEMQWFLNRVTALQGAAVPRELPADESESDSDDGLP